MAPAAHRTPLNEPDGVLAGCANRFLPVTEPIAERGMAVGFPDAPEIVLTVEDVARLAVAVADIHGLTSTTPNGGDRSRTRAMADADVPDTPGHG